MTATMDLEVEEEKKVETLTLDGVAVRFEHRLVEVKDGVFEDSFAPYAVHLYELPFAVDTVGSPDRESISWRRWQRRWQ